LEKLNTDLSDSSNGEINLVEKMIMAIFLEGLPKEFKATVDSLLAGRVYDHGIVLLRLHNVTDWKTPGKEVDSKSASNVKQLTCWNCGEVGHQKINYPEPEKGSDDKNSGKKKSRGKDSDKGKSKGKKSDHESGHGKRKDKKKSYCGSARKANESDDLSNGSESESESGSDETTNWVRLIQCGNDELPDAEDQVVSALDSAGRHCGM
jgi:hypothetical protein